MGAEPLKKELEAIDEELESAMLRLAETTQRVDDILADFNESDGPKRRAPAILSLHPATDEGTEEDETEPASGAEAESENNVDAAEEH